MDENVNIPVFTLIENNDLCENIEETSEENIFFISASNESHIEKLLCTNHEEAHESTSPITQNEAEIELFGHAISPFKVLNLDCNLITLDDNIFCVVTNEAESVQLMESQIRIEDEPRSVETENGPLEHKDIENKKADTISSDHSTNETTQDHQLQLGSNDKPKRKFQCVYKGCQKSYSTSKRLAMHIRSHSNNKRFVCTYENCQNTFCSKYALTTHIRIHTGEKPYPCTDCSKRFKTSSDLQKHKRVHTKEKPFQCPVAGCGKSFANSNIRLIHIRSHTGEKPYVCTFLNCEKSFSTSTNFKNHLRTHSGEKPYVCAVEGCNKRFTEYSSLYKHKNVHRIDKSFKCNFCQQIFKCKQSLNIHSKVKHSVVVFV